MRRPTRGGDAGPDGRWARGRPGRDRRARRLPAPAGSPTVPSPAPRVAVVGGGIAGLAAATALAERGARVVLYERGPHLGGRLAGWPTVLADGTRVTMSRGFHAFFRQYYNLRALLRRVDPTLGMLTALPDYPLWHADGLRDGFARVPRTPPWNAAGFVLRSPSFRWAELRHLRPRAALGLLDVRLPEVYRRWDGLSARELLTAIRFPTAAEHLAFGVFSRSFFADPGELSAAELALMFHVYFLGSAEGLLFDVVNEPFPTALWHPLARRLRQRGVRVRTGRPVRAVLPRPDGGFLLHLGRPGRDAAPEEPGEPDEPGAGPAPAGDGEAAATGDAEVVDVVDAVVLATDVDGLRRLVARSPGLGGERWRRQVAALRTAPPFLVSRLWLDRPVRPDRPAFLGTAGYGPLDNVSVLERWEGEAARWAARTAGSVVELHAYAVPADADRAAVERELLARLHQVYPETRRARVVDARHLWRADCPLFPVGGFADRPGVRTGDPAVVAAGDWAAVDLPVALMERAATTGFLAANALLARWGVAGHELWTVPTSGRSAALRALARLAASPPAGRDGVPGRPGPGAAVVGEGAAGCAGRPAEEAQPPGWRPS